MSSAPESSAHPAKSAEAGSDIPSDSSQDISRQEQGELQQNDYDVETVEAVYKFVSCSSPKPEMAANRT